MFWLILSFAVWGIVHSLLASLAVKGFFRRVFGAGFMRIYRLAYNVFSFISFLPILWLVAFLPNRILYSVPAPWSYLMLAGQAAGALGLFAAVLQTDTLSFVGLRQLFEEEKPGKLVTGGLYKYVRHPIYTFSLIFLWLTPIMTINTLIFYIAATLYFIVGAYFEERKLLREFGAVYAEYKSVTPMLIPRLLQPK